MNKPLLISPIVSASAITGSTLVAGDVFDSPGPGYRQQIERAFGAAVKEVSRDINFGSAIIRVVPTSFPTPTLPMPEIPTASLLQFREPTHTFAVSGMANTFSAPIRLFIDSSVAAPAPAEKKGTK